MSEHEGEKMNMEKEERRNKIRGERGEGGGKKEERKEGERKVEKKSV